MFCSVPRIAPVCHRASGYSTLSQRTDMTPHVLKDPRAMELDLVDPDGVNPQRLVDTMNDLKEEESSSISRVKNIMRKLRKLSDKKLAIIVDTQTLKTGGLPGPPGPQGSKGHPGYQGAPGAEGNRGPQGVQGPDGNQGQPGTRGFRGETGDTGIEGPRGAAGLVGEPGYMGETSLGCVLRLHRIQPSRARLPSLLRGSVRVHGMSPLVECRPPL